MLVFPANPTPIAPLEIADIGPGLTEGLQCFAPLSYPGRKAANLMLPKNLLTGGGLAPGGLAAQVTGAHYDWHNSFGSAYTVAMWCTGFDFDAAWQSIFGIGDSTITWQRDGSNNWIKVYHNGTGNTFSELTLAELAEAGLHIAEWSTTYNQMDYEINRVNVATRAMFATPKTDSTTSTLGFGRLNTVYWFAVWNRLLKSAEKDRLYNFRNLLVRPHNRRTIVPAIPSATVHQLSGTIAATAGASATLNGSLACSGSAAALSTASGSLGVGKPLTGSAAATSGTGTATLGVAKPLTGSAAAVSATGTPAITCAKSLVGTSTAIAGADATLNASLAFVGAASAAAGADATLNGTLSCTGSAAATAGADATLNAALAFAGTIAATSNVLAATLSTEGEIPLSGSLAATSGASGTLGVAKPLAGTIAAAATTSTPTLETGGPVPLSGSIAATSNVSGALSVAKPIAGNAAATSSTTPNPALEVSRGLGGSIAATAGASGTVRAARLLVGSVDATAVVAGGISVGRPLAGSIAALATCDGTLSVPGTVLLPVLMLTLEKKR
jgi:hypothetical protein